MTTEEIINKLIYYKEIKGVNYKFWADKVGITKGSICLFIKGERTFSKSLLEKLELEIKNYNNY